MHSFEDVKNHRDVILKKSKTYPTLMVAKYHRRCFYDGRWDSITKESRGHVWHESGKLVIGGPTKIFNRFEMDTDIPRDEVALYVEKINGFLGCATYVPEVDDVVISTTGSLDSDFVGYVKDKIPVSFHKFLKLNPYHTAFFEIVHEKDPHIIEEINGAYLLGIRNNFDVEYRTDEKDQEQLDSIADEYNLLRPAWGMMVFGDIVKTVKDLNIEGRVVYGEGTALKLKSPYYKHLKMIARKEDIMSLDLSRIDEEYFNLVSYIKSVPGFKFMEEQRRLELMRVWLEENPF